MIKMLFLFLALLAARDQCEIEYCFKSIALFIIRKHSNVVWQWFYLVSTLIHHGGRQHLFIECLAYNFTVTQIWTVDGFCRLFLKVNSHRLTCIYMLDQTKVEHTFVRPHLDYGDILFDQTYNSPFHEKLESVQYNACLALTGGIRGFWKRKYIKNLVLSPFGFVIGTENFAFSIRSSIMNILNIFLI